MRTCCGYIADVLEFHAKELVLMGNKKFLKNLRHGDNMIMSVPGMR